MARILALAFIAALAGCVEMPLVQRVGDTNVPPDALVRLHAESTPPTIGATIGSDPQTYVLVVGVDGSAQAMQYQFAPGRHRLRVVTGHSTELPESAYFDGDLDVYFHRPGEYALYASWTGRGLQFQLERVRGGETWAVFMAPDSTVYMPFPAPMRTAR